jgi:hypothetical protein
MSKTTEYIGNISYEGGISRRILFNGGYIEGSVYHYHLNDHQGNNEYGKPQSEGLNVNNPQ